MYSMRIGFQSCSQWLPLTSWKGGEITNQSNILKISVPAHKSPHLLATTAWHSALTTTLTSRFDY